MFSVASKQQAGGQLRLRHVALCAALVSHAYPAALHTLATNGLTNLVGHAMGTATYPSRPLQMLTTATFVTCAALVHVGLRDGSWINILSASPSQLLVKKRAEFG